MLVSMTGYGRATLTGPEWQLDCEIRTVNNRYLDLRLRLPTTLYYAEMAVRKSLQSVFHRGRVECTIQMHSETVAPCPQVNEGRLQALVAQVHNVFNKEGMHAAFPAGDFLQLEGILETWTPSFDEKKMQEDVLSVCTQAAKQTLAMRCAEGERLEQDLRTRLQTMEHALDIVRSRAPYLASEEQGRMQERLQQLLDAVPVDETLLANEIALYAQKIDIAEEVVRLQSHIEAFREALDRQQPVGKMLDFLVQEMNREVNTMSSKVNDRDLTVRFVEMKEKIEQLREQIQNIE